MRFSSRALSSQRGFVLVSALGIAVLYLGLIEMLWYDAGQRVREAQRFRSRVEAQILAENAADLAAQNLVSAQSSDIEATLPEGSMSASMKRFPDETFLIEATGKGSRLMKYEARVTIHGRINDTEIEIVRTEHWP